MGMRDTARDWWRSVHYPAPVEPVDRRLHRVLGLASVLLTLAALIFGIIAVVDGRVLAVTVGFGLIGFAGLFMPTAWTVYRSGRDEEDR